MSYYSYGYSRASHTIPGGKGGIRKQRELGETELLRRRIIDHVTAHSFTRVWLRGQHYDNIYGPSGSPNQLASARAIERTLGKSEIDRLHKEDIKRFGEQAIRQEYANARHYGGNKYHFTSPEGSISTQPRPAPTPAPRPAPVQRPAPAPAPAAPPKPKIGPGISSAPDAPGATKSTRQRATSVADTGVGARRRRGGGRAGRRSTILSGDTGQETILGD